MNGFALVITSTWIFSQTYAREDQSLIPPEYQKDFQNMKLYAVSSCDGKGVNRGRAKAAQEVADTLRDRLSEFESAMEVQSAIIRDFSLIDFPQSNKRQSMVRNRLNRLSSNIRSMESELSNERHKLSVMASWNQSEGSMAKQKAVIGHTSDEIERLKQLRRELRRNPSSVIDLGRARYEAALKEMERLTQAMATYSDLYDQVRKCEGEKNRQFTYAQIQEHAPEVLKSLSAETLSDFFGVEAGVLSADDKAASAQ